nr:class I SAM-dependent methyltransferase [Rhodococcus sp. HNM0569]
MFPTAYQSTLEQYVVAAFADHVYEHASGGFVLDIGCGIGHVTADLADRGLDVLGVEPSRGMLDIARREHPGLRFAHDDAALGATAVEGRALAGVLARSSLIHLPPREVPAVLAGWAARMEPGGVVLIAGQATDTPGAVEEFDHAVAPAWRWHPDRVSEALSAAGFDELWRTLSRPDAGQRFPVSHVLARRRGSSDS